MEPRLLWKPDQRVMENSNLSHYIQWLRNNKSLSFSDYHALWQWSVDHLEEFWKSVWEYFTILHDGEIKTVVTSSPMPHTQWFTGTKLNYAEHIFRKSTDEHPAIVYSGENGHVEELSWKELYRQTGSVQQFLKNKGLTAGDRVVAYMPCIPEATIAFLAANSLGAIWSSCSPDFGINAVIERFVQIEPKVLITVDEYSYNGKTFDKNDVIRALVKAIPSLEQLIVITERQEVVYDKPATHWSGIVSDRGYEIEFVRVPFEHPIWVLYSSGTTGLPKAITHSHGGILLEQLKYGAFHNDFKAGERCFWYTTTGWMMWNYIHASLLTGATMVIYDGSPAYPDLNALWRFTEHAQINHFGTSAGFILANIKSGIRPGTDFDLTPLRSIGSTGSTLPPEGFDWVYKEVKKDLWLASMSGGTDVCTAFVGGNPTWPVYAGEIQCRALGCKLEAFNDEGVPLQDEVGEMVITKPMPSMPVFFWNDPEYKRYHESYFGTYPGVWRHGDWTMITPRHGVIIYGRSDATLNRGGVRIGTSEVYRAIDKVKEVKDSLIVCIEKAGGEFWMPLFITLNEGIRLTDELKHKINTAIRQEYSPRHVPDEIITVPDIPYTISGKKTETPVKKVLMGKDPEKVVNAGALRNPASMKFFIDLYKATTKKL